MTINIYKRILTMAVVVLCSLLCATAVTSAQSDDGRIYIQPLFTYPTAPDYLDDIGARSDYLMDNFWNDMNFKQKTVSQEALNHAFKVYVTPMQWASKAKVLNSVDALLGKLKKNPGLQYQFTRAAENNLYGPTADLYIDEVYIKFLEAIQANKKVPAKLRKHYSDQLAAISATAPGMEMPEISLSPAEDDSVVPSRGKYYTLIYLGKTADSTLRQYLLKVETSVALQKLIESRDMAVWCVALDLPSESGDAFLKSLTPGVTRGYSSDAAELLDLRLPVSVYLLDGEGRVLLKNVDPSTALMSIKRPE